MQKYGEFSRLVITIRLPDRLVGRIEADAFGGEWTARDATDAERLARRLSSTYR